MAPRLTRPPFVADERTQVLGWLDLQRRGNPQFAEAEDADFMVEGVPLAQLLDDFDAQWARSNEVVATASLDDV